MRLTREPGFWHLFGLSGWLETTKLLWFVLTPLWMYRVSHSATDVALVPLANMLAMGIAGLVGGRLADRDPARLLVGSLSGVAVLALVGALVATQFAMAVGSILGWTFGLDGGFHLASLGRTVLTNQAFRHRLVDINSAVGLVHSLVKALGPLLAGVLALWLSVPAGMLLTLAVAAGLSGTAWGIPSVRTVRSGRRDASEPQPANPTVGRYVQPHRGLAAGIGYFILWRLSAGVYSSLFCVLLLRVAHGTPATYPLAMALQGAGNLAVASTVPALHRRWRGSVLVGAATLLIVGAEEPIGHRHRSH